MFKRSDAQSYDWFMPTLSYDDELECGDYKEITIMRIGNFDQRIRESGIPEHMKDTVLNYVMDGTPMGSFGTALFSNNLMETFACADSENFQAVGEYVNFIYNHAPMGCHGSLEKVNNWIYKGGLNETSK